MLAPAQGQNPLFGCVALSAVDRSFIVSTLINLTLSTVHKQPYALLNGGTWSPTRLSYSYEMTSFTGEDDKTIQLPMYVGARNINGLFQMCEEVRQSDGPIILNGSEVRFVDPLGIAVLGALLEPLKDVRPCRIEWLSVDVGTYLDRMDVLSRCGIEGVNARCGVRHDRRDSLVELTCVTQPHEVDQAAESLATAIAGTLTPHNPDAPIDMETGRNEFDNYRYPLSYVLRELLLNALTHARKEGRQNAAVWVAAQYFKPKSQVQLAVVDNGCGVLSTLRHSPELRSASHLEAIRTALKPFVTCNPDIGLPGGTANQGVGLTMTARVAAAARGGILLASGDAATATLENQRILDMPLGPHSFWPGVAIQVVCRRAMLPTVNIPELLPKLEVQPEIELRFAP